MEVTIPKSEGHQFFWNGYEYFIHADGSVWRALIIEPIYHQRRRGAFVAPAENAAQALTERWEPSAIALTRQWWDSLDNPADACYD